MSCVQAKGAEVARLVVSSGTLAPERLVRRLRDEPIAWEHLSVSEVERQVRAGAPPSPFEGGSDDL